MPIWLSLIPWRLVAVAVACAGVWFAWTEHGASRYQDGRRDMQAVVVAQVQEEQRALQELANKHQEKVNEIAAADQERISLLERRVSALDTGTRGLRERLTAVVASTVGPPEAPGATGQPDAGAAALGSISSSCSDLAAGLARDAERLADQVRGLQSYAVEVSGAPLNLEHSQ
jgi:hypothetical protein